MDRAFLLLLSLLFIGLKLTGYITWSWWWVTVPLWGGAALALSLVGLIFLVGLIIGVTRK